MPAFCLNFARFQQMGANNQRSPASRTARRHYAARISPMANESAHTVVVVITFLGLVLLESAKYAHSVGIEIVFKLSY